MKRLYTTAGGALLIGAIYLLGWSPLLSAHQVSIVGAPTDASYQLIATKADINPGDKLARIDPRAISTKLKKLSWIDSVSVKRNWFSRAVTITVTSREAIGVFNNFSIDKSGALFELPGGSDSSLPHVIAKTRADGLKAIELFTSLPSDFQSKVTQLSAYNSVSFAMKVNEKVKEGSRVISVVFGSASDVDLKVRVYNALIQREENAAIRRIDLSAPHAPIVK